MVLRDIDIKRIGNRIIKPFDSDAVYSIGYDLRIDSFFDEDGNEYEEINLERGEYAIVESIEEISLPNDMMAEVVLRNRWIRKGLELAAPIYQPGHHTKIFFRIRNISKKSLSFSKADRIASIMLKKTAGSVGMPYHGRYADEMNYIGIGD